MQALNLREIQKDAKNAYYECKNVEKALQRHVQDVIEDKYLKSLVDKDTQLIQDEIPTVLQFLFNAYRKIPSKEVTTAFKPADPMIILYNPIEKLRKMVEYSNIAYTENQILDIGLTVIRNTRDFEKALGDWENLPTTEKIWARFKTHFTAAQQQLKAIRGPTMQQEGYHHANHLARQLCDNMQHRDNGIMSILHTAMDSNSVTPSIVDSDLSTPTPLHHQANATQADTTQLEILK